MSNRLNSVALNTLLVVLVGTFLIAFSWHRDYSDLLSDSGIYLLLASKFSPTQTIPDSLYTLIMTEYHLPPGFPLALGLFGAGAHHPTISHAINALFLAAGVAVYAVWVRSNGLPTALAYALAILFMLLPATLFFSLEILSEHLYLPLSLLSLLLMQRSSDGYRPYAAALLVGMAILTRSIGIALLPALMMSVYRGGKGLSLKVFVAALLLPLVWFLYKSQYSTGNYAHSFLQGLHGHDLVPYLWQRSMINLQLLWYGWVKSLDLIGLSYAVLISAGILSVASLGWLQRLQRLRPDAVYFGCYFCIILVWPHGSHMQRFLFPVLPLLLFYAAKCSYDFAIRYKSTNVPRLIPWAVLATVLIIALPTHARALSRTLSPLPDHVGAFGRSQQWLFAANKTNVINQSAFLSRLYAAIKQSGSIAVQDCIWSIDPPRHMLLSLRASYETSPPGLGQDEFQERLRKCRYVFAMNVRPRPNPHGYTAMYPSDRLPPAYTPLQTMTDSDQRTVSVLYRLTDAR